MLYKEKSNFCIQLEKSSSSGGGSNNLPKQSDYPQKVFEWLMSDALH